MVLVDTSIWIEYLDRGNEEVGRQLDNLLLQDQAATAGLVMAELRSGCRTNVQVRNLVEAMEPLIYLEVDRGSWFRAGEIAAEVAARGFRLEVGDCILAALAFRESCLLYTLDGDFERIPGLKLFRTRIH